MNHRLSIGLDLGGTRVRAALVQAGKVLRRSSVRTDVSGGPEAVMAQFRTLASRVCIEGALERVVAVGLCAPGPLDTVTGIVDHIPTLPGWEQFPLLDQLGEAFKRPAVLENDGIAAAYGEWQYGAGVGLEHLVYVTVSTGIGGGVVVDGRLMRGRRGMAAHVGHFRLVPNGPACSCSTAGCFEAVAAGTALGKRARAVALGNPSGFLGMKSESERLEAHHVVEGARDHDSECLVLLEEEAEYLGVGFTGLIHLFSPERLVMGGGVARAFDLLSEGIHAVIRRDAMAPFKDVPVVPATLGDNSGLVGAASLALKLATDA